MSGEYSAHNIFVEFQAKGQVDLLSNARTTVSWVALLHFHDGIDDFSGWTLWTSLLPSTW